MNDFRTQQYYRERAAEYEQIYFRNMPIRRKEIDDESNRLRGYVAGRTVLELACGTGYWTRVMAQTASSIIALDIWMEMLEEARKKQYQIDVNFIRADMEQLPVKPGVFDFIAVGFWFSHQPRQDYASFFELLKYPLKKNGLIWMIDNNPSAEGQLNESVGFDEYGNNFKKRSLSDGREYVILKNYFNEKELRHIFEPAFKIRQLIYQEYYWSLLLTF